MEKTFSIPYGFQHVILVLQGLLGGKTEESEEI